MELYSSQESLELIRGAFDMHIHSAPSLFPRLMDDFELSAELQSYGIRGGVIKSHAGCTASRATIANKHSGKNTRLYGSLTLNYFVGIKSLCCGFGIELRRRRSLDAHNSC